MSDYNPLLIMFVFYAAVIAVGVFLGNFSVSLVASWLLARANRKLLKRQDEAYNAAIEKLRVYLHEATLKQAMLPSNEDDDKIESIN